LATAATQTRHNRTITVDFRDEAIYFRLLGDGKAFLECVLAFVLSLGFQLTHKATCRGGGCLTRHSHYVRVRLGGVTIWRLQCTRCKAVFTILPHFALRYRSMRPEVARDALLATHGGLSLELCAVLYHVSPMALYRLICALGQQSLVIVLTRCGLPLPVYFLTDEKHSRCLTEKVYLPTIVCGRVLWHLGYTKHASMAAFTQSYQEFQRAAVQQEPTYQVRGILTDGFDSTTSRMRTLFPGARLEYRKITHPLEGSRQEAILPLAQLLTTFFCCVPSGTPRSQLVAADASLFSCVWYRLGKRRTKHPSGSRPLPSRSQARRLPLAPSVPQKTVSSLPCPIVYSSQMPWLPWGSCCPMAHGRGVARLHNPSAGSLG
jgi:hypothetical protein